MGQRGPVPARSSERRRRNKDSKTTKVKPPAAAGAKNAKTTPDGKVKRPPAASHWHAIAKSWYVSLAESGQSIYYEPSDWQAARYVAEIMSRHLKAAKPSAQLFTGIWAAMTDLLTTEGARRRVRMEIERPDNTDDTGKVTALDSYRDRLTGS